VLLEEGIDFVITDSPLILTHFYGMKYDWLEKKCSTSKVMLQHHHIFCKEMGYKVEHFVVKRNKQYNPKGRYQTEEEAIQFDTEIMQLLDSMGIKFTTISDTSEILQMLPKVKDFR
jgi:hypothetical protein